MTVSTSINSVVYRGNGATTQFAVPFKVLDVEHLLIRRRVFVTGTIEHTYVGTDYSYAGIGTPDGTLTLAGAALGNTYELVIERIVPYTQDLDIVNAGGFYPETVEEQLDLIVMEIQQVAEIAGRSVTVPAGETVSELPIASYRAGKFPVFDANGDITVTDGIGSDSSLRSDLAADGGPLVRVTPRGLLASTATLSEYAQFLPLFIESFREAGDTDREVLTKAFDAWEAQGGGTLVGGGPEVVYDLGDENIIGGVSTSTVIFAVTGLTNATLDLDGASIMVNSGEWAGLGTYNIPVIFKFTNCQNLVIRNIGKFQDTGYVNTRDWQGAYFIEISGNAGPCKGVTLDNVHMDGGLGPLVVRGTQTNRVSGIWITQSCYFNNVYYGSSFQDNGDKALLEYTCENVLRAYIGYGFIIHHFNMRVIGSATPLAEGAFVFMRADRDTWGVTGQVVFSGSLDNWRRGVGDPGYLFGFQQQNNDGATALLGGFDLKLFIVPGTQDTNGTHRLRFSSFTTGAVSENTGSTTHRFGMIRLGGDLGGIAHPFHSRCTPAVPPVIALANGVSGLGPTPTIGCPGFILQTGPNHYMIEKFGDLTSGTVKMPMASLADTISLLRVIIAASAKSNANTDGASSKAHIFRDDVGVYLLGTTSGELTGSPGAGDTSAFNSSNLTRAYAGNANGDLVITLGGSDYAVSTAYARVTVEALLRPI